MGPVGLKLFFFFFFYELQIADKDVVWAERFKQLKQRHWGLEQQVADICRLIALRAFERRHHLLPNCPFKHPRVWLSTQQLLFLHVTKSHALVSMAICLLGEVLTYIYLRNHIFKPLTEFLNWRNAFGLKVELGPQTKTNSQWISGTWPSWQHLSPVLTGVVF